MQYYRTIGGKIKDAREKSGFSQQQLANAIGKKTSTYITFIESGRRKVSLEDLEEIAKVLNQPLNFFLEKASAQEEVKDQLYYALRADSDLNTNQRSQVIEFYEFMKAKSKNRKSD